MTIVQLPPLRLSPLALPPPFSYLAPTDEHRAAKAAHFHDVFYKEKKAVSATHKCSKP